MEHKVKTIVVTHKDRFVRFGYNWFPNHPESAWMKEVSLKSIKKSIENGWIAFTRFFKGYIPMTKDGDVIKSGTVSMKAGRYYVSVFIEVPDIPVTKCTNNGIAIDLGVKHFAVMSNGKIYKNINKSAR